MTTQTRMTLEDFLALPEDKPYREYLNGEVWEKPWPNEDHGALTSELIRRVGNYLVDSGEGRVRNEVRHEYVAPPEERVYLPDIHVTLDTSLRGHEGENPVRVQPDLAIEVLSPDDRATRVLDRVQFYMRAGTRLLWLIDPEAETITVCRPGRADQVARSGDVIDAKPVLRSFSLDVGELFAILHPKRAS